MRGFEPLELVEKVVEFLVGDLRIVEDVVLLFVMTDQAAQLADADNDARRGWRHPTGRARGRSRGAPAARRVRRSAGTRTAASSRARRTRRRGDTRSRWTDARGGSASARPT